jgi:branched-chain amino acid transport system ATP-binding protein
MAEPILRAEQVCKHFGGLRAVDGVSVSVAPGSLHSIIGPNGAGKTTFFNLLSGVLQPTSGQIYFKGRPITGLPLHRIAHLGIGRSFQITNLFPHLTVLENVRLAVQAHGADNFRLLNHFSTFRRYIEAAEQAIAAVGLSGREHLPANVLPHGDKRKLELAILLAPDPELLLLDEPTAGMASEQVSELLEIIRNARRGGSKTIMLVEHNMNVVMSLSDRITVMHQGQVIAEGTPSQIATNETVQVAYLGGLYEEEMQKHR